MMNELHDRQWQARAVPPNSPEEACRYGCGQWWAWCMGVNPCVDELAAQERSKFEIYPEWFSANEIRLGKATERDVICLAMYEVAGWDIETAGNLADFYADAYGAITPHADVVQLSEFLMAIAELPDFNPSHGETQFRTNARYQIEISPAGIRIDWDNTTLIVEGESVSMYCNGEEIS